MALQVTLVHNPQAGFNPVDKQVLLQALQNKGYAVKYIDTRQDDIDKALGAPADLVIIAGGDGTIRKISRQLFQKGVPVALLPLGTANNIATSIGIKGEATDIIAAMDINRKKAFDVGLMNSTDGEIHFLESAGFGLLPRLIREHSKDDRKANSREEELRQAREHFIEMISKHEANQCSLWVEGREYSGKFLVVQVMNIALTGPNVLFAPTADPGNGEFQVVMIRENERDAFIRYVKNSSEKGYKADLPQMVTGKNIRIEWEGGQYHADDESYRAATPIKASISLVPHVLEVLV